MGSLLAVKGSAPTIPPSGHTWICYGNTIENLPSQASKLPQWPSGKDLYPIYHMGIDGCIAFSVSGEMGRPFFRTPSLKANPCSLGPGIYPSAISSVPPLSFLTIFTLSNWKYWRESCRPSFQ